MEQNSKVDLKPVKKTKLPPIQKSSIKQPNKVQKN